MPESSPCSTRIGPVMAVAGATMTTNKSRLSRERGMALKSSIEEEFFGRESTQKTRIRKRLFFPQGLGGMDLGGAEGRQVTCRGGYYGQRDARQHERGWIIGLQAEQQRRGCASGEQGQSWSDGEANAVEE